LGLTNVLRARAAAFNISVKPALCPEPRETGFLSAAGTDESHASFGKLNERVPSPGNEIVDCTAGREWMAQAHFLFPECVESHVSANGGAETRLGRHSSSVSL
jgi:hypothetical protein